MVDLTVAELAGRLGVTQRRANDIVSTGAVSARQLANGTWLIESDSVARYELRRKSSGRSLSPPTAWGLLWELSDLRSTWLTESTRARVRKRIREWTVGEIATAVAVRTRMRRYRAANVDRVAADIIGSGRFATDAIDTDLLVDRRRVFGYVPRGADVDMFALDHFMSPDETGADVLLENTLPTDYTGRVMPAGVIAADLALSTDTRERSAGLTALNELRETWLAKRS
jgi:hypothetical protein